MGTENGEKKTKDPLKGLSLLDRARFMTAISLIGGWNWASKAPTFAEVAYRCDDTVAFYNRQMEFIRRGDYRQIWGV